MEIQASRIRAGYTSQEHDPELGLINMKGRLYDPALRRFTTADPYVTEPLNPQGLNRYSYVQNNPMNFTDPSGFCMSAGECAFEASMYSQMAMAQAQAQANSQAMAQAAAQASAMGEAAAAEMAQQMADLSNAGSNQAGADAQAQNWAQMGELANQASARAGDQIQAQNITNQDAQRAHDAAFVNPYTTPLPSPETGNGLYYGPPMGANWTGYLADSNGAGGGSNQQRDAATNGSSATGQPTPYMEKVPVWLQVAASMCLLPEVSGAIKLWKLADEVESTVGAKEVTTLQRGGNTISRSTADALNRSTGMNQTPREWGRALESLKASERIPNNFHGSIDSLGNIC